MKIKIDIKVNLWLILTTVLIVVGFYKVHNFGGKLLIALGSCFLIDFFINKLTDKITKK
jgi:hypothetical protein